MKDWYMLSKVNKKEREILKESEKLKIKKETESKTLSQIEEYSARTL